ncbi:MAG: hypothetical protein NDJ92_04030 [Thermoanaerobaculia bacterium]|nr:hypothetical protein [Thermoanaerobaculia bacterium]
MDQNEEHLRLLSIFHYVVAAFAALFALFPLIHLVIGIAILTGSFPSDGIDSEARWVGGFFVAFASVWILAGTAFAVAVFLAGRNLARRTRYTFCLVVGGIECMFVPFGTVLGVLTIIVLMKEPVKAIFGVALPPSAQ